MSKKIISVSGYLEISNQITQGRTDMKPIQLLLCLVILQRIQSKIKKDKKENNKNINKIKISKKYLLNYFNKKILTQSYMDNIIDDILQEHCINMKDKTLENFLIDISYDNEVLDIEYDDKKLYNFLIMENNYTQLDLEYVCKKCAKSKNAIHIYMLICRVKSTGILKIKKETLIYILGKDHIKNYPISKLTRDVKNALELMSDLLGNYNIEYISGVYVIKFKKFKIEKSTNYDEVIYDDDVI